MLNISNLSIHFGGNYLFKDVNLAVGHNDKIGLVGRNGSGKSTLLKIISGYEEPENGKVSYPKDFTIGYLPQEIKVESDKTIFIEAKEALKEIVKLENKLKELNEEISIRDDYQSEDYLKTVEEVSHINDRLNILGAHRLDAEIERILLGLGFERIDFTRPVSEFSGGWQMRLELAKILLRKPNIVLLDEPTNHLDIESVVWLESFLKNYFGAIILVSHDRKFLDTITNRTIEISLGKIYDYNYSYSKYVVQRKIDKEQQLAAYLNQKKEIEKTERFIERFRAKANLATRVQSKVKQLEKMERIEVEDEDISEISLSFPEPPRSGKLIVESNRLSKSYGKNLVLDNIEFDIERGEKIAFVGKNGEGKSTLSKILSGELDYSGELKFGHNVVTGYFAQHQAQMLDESKTVFQIIDDEAIGDMRKNVRNLLGAFLFSGDDVDKKVKVLSGGEKSRLAIAKLLLNPINFLIMDEPTNHLDMRAKDVLKNALLNFDASLVIVSHDREFLDGLTNKTIYFKDKKLTVYPGSINEFLEKFQIQEIDDININKTSKNRNESNSKDAKEYRNKQKLFNKEKNKLQKELNLLENNIDKIENEMKELDELFSNPEFYSNPKASQKQIEYKNKKDNLENLMSDWEKIQTKIENLSD